jgi:hypothetical protein
MENTLMTMFFLVLRKEKSQRFSVFLSLLLECQLKDVGKISQRKIWMEVPVTSVA